MPISNPGVVPASTIWKFVDTEVFAAASTTPIAWTDLDLSSVVGAQECLVVLAVVRSGGLLRAGFRTNGDSRDFYNTTYECSINYTLTNNLDPDGSVLVKTDANGVVEWFTSGAVTGATVDVLAYCEAAS